MAITGVKDCVMQITVVTVQEQEKGNVHVDKLVSMFCKFLPEPLFLLASERSDCHRKRKMDRLTLVLGKLAACENNFGHLV